MLNSHTSNVRETIMRRILLAPALLLALGGCGYNTLQSNDEQIKAGWSEVVNLPTGEGSAK